MNSLNFLLNPLVLVLVIGLFLASVSAMLASRIKLSRKQAALAGPDADLLLGHEQSVIRPSLHMKLAFSVPLVLLVVLVAFVAYIADQMFGLVAFTYGYLAFCVLAALVFGAAWRACSPKSAPAFALGVFAVLAANFLLPAPSERLLRSAMLEAAPGTDAAAIVDIVKQQYEGSPYEMPQISEDNSGGYDRVNVSLISQKSRSCTSVIFLVENGKVSRSFFSAD